MENVSISPNLDGNKLGILRAGSGVIVMDEGVVVVELFGVE